MARRVSMTLVAAGLVLSCQQGPPPGQKTHKRVLREIREAEKLMAEGRFDDARAEADKAEKDLSKVARLTRRRGAVWGRAKKSRSRLESLKGEIASREEEAIRLVEEEKRREAEELEKYVARPEEEPEGKEEERRDTYVDRDVTLRGRFAPKERAEEKPFVEEKPKPPEEKPPIPADIEPKEPVTVVKVEAKGNYIVCYVVFYNPGPTTYLASLQVDFIGEKGSRVTYNRMTYRAEGFKPDWSNIYESKGVGVAANELVVREKGKVNLVGVGDSPRAGVVRKAKVTVATTDEKQYTGRGPK